MNRDSKLIFEHWKSVQEQGYPQQPYTQQPYVQQPQQTGNFFTNMFNRQPKQLTIQDMEKHIEPVVKSIQKLPLPEQTKNQIIQSMANIIYRQMSGMGGYPSNFNLPHPEVGLGSQ